MSGPEGWNYFSMEIAKVLGMSYLNESLFDKNYKDYNIWISYI